MAEILIIDGYDVNLSNVVSKGLFLPLYEAQKDGKKYLVRLIEKTRLTKEKINYINQEVKVLSGYESPYILKLIEGPLINPMYVMLVYEHCNRGSLANYIKSTVFPNELIQQMVQQLWIALCILHDEEIQVRAITPQTILLHEEDSRITFKLGDLMLATKKHESVQGQLSESVFLSTELYSDTVNPNVDLYSIGLLIQAIMQHRQGPPPPMDTNLQHLLKRCMDKNVQTRISLIDLMAHPFLVDNDKEGKDYTLVKPLGRGGFGEVKLMKENSTGHLYAIKNIDIDRLTLSFDEPIVNEDYTQLVRELTAMYVTCSKKVNHDYLLKIKTHFLSDHLLYIVMEYCEGGNLFGFISSKPKGLPKDLLRQIAKELAKAMESIHSLDIVHRDMKPENVLLTSADPTKLSIKLCDYGLAKHLRPKDELMSKSTQSILYLPEEGTGDKISTSYDMWSYGVICYHMAFGAHPMNVPNSRNSAIQLRDLRERGKFGVPAKHSVDPGFIDIIKDCLNPDPQQRATAAQVLAHPWFAEK